MAQTRQKKKVQPQTKNRKAAATAGRAPSKKTTAKTGRPAKKSPPKKRGVGREVFVLCSAVVCVLLALGNFGMAGAVGGILAAFEFGMFGRPAYILPIYIFIVVVVWALRDYRHPAKAFGRFVLSFAILVSASGLFQLFGGNPVAETYNSPMYYYFNGAGAAPGGLFGGLLCMLLRTGLGTAASCVILIAAIGVCTILLTGIDVFVPLGRKGRDAAARAALNRERRKEKQARATLEYRRGVEAETRRVRATRMETERKISGVTFDTTLDPTPTPVPGTLKGGRDAGVRPADSKTQSATVRGTKENDTHTGQETVGLSGIPENAAGFEETVPFDADTLMANAGTLGEITISGSAESDSGASKKARPAVQDAGADSYGNRPDGRTSAGQDISGDVAINSENIPQDKPYVFPDINLLKVGKKGQKCSERELKETAIKLQKALASYGVGVTVTDISCGPTVTRYALKPEQGVKVSQILNRRDDIKLTLAAAEIRIEAPIPGKSAIGIEVPNSENQTVYLREIVDSEEFKRSQGKLVFAVGRGIGGDIVLADISKMPHLLIAGATGSGKSVCINTIIMSILFRADPTDVRMIMIDPKVVELSVYNGIPHLLTPVVTEPKKAAGALNWAVGEMTRRYKLFKEYDVKEIKAYNKLAKEEPGLGLAKLPQILIIVDELADLMMVSPADVQDSICRLAQLARAAGLHLVLATQRPSVNVITGMIKANVQSRIAFAVSSFVDSKTILDTGGAEKLLGRGDMLFHPSGEYRPVRIQGAFVSDAEINAVAEFLKSQNGELATKAPESLVEDMEKGPAQGGVAVPENNRDELFARCARFVIEKEKATTNVLQRTFRIGYNRAARIMDQLYEAGVVGPEDGTKPRKVIMTMENFDQMIEYEREHGV